MGETSEHDVIQVKGYKQRVCSLKQVYNGPYFFMYYLKRDLLNCILKM